MLLVEQAALVLQVFVLALALPFSREELSQVLVLPLLVEQVSSLF